jgi:endonuclease G
MKIWLILASILFTIVILATVQGQGPPDKIPYCNGELISRDHYQLCYDEEWEQARWVYYRLTAEEATTKTVKRDNKFREDSLVSNSSATHSDYRNSGYDRGHLAPSADMCFSRGAMQDSFYYSNMSPQHPGLNRNGWAKLEGHTRDLAKEHGEVLVYTGPVIVADIPKKTIGVNKVGVPDFYYKIIVIGDDSICYVMPNKPINTYENSTIDCSFLKHVIGLDL